MEKLKFIRKYRQSPSVPNRERYFRSPSKASSLSKFKVDDVRNAIGKRQRPGFYPETKRQTLKNAYNVSISGQKEFHKSVQELSLNGDQPAGCVEEVVDVSWLSRLSLRFHFLQATIGRPFYRKRSFCHQDQILNRHRYGRWVSSAIYKSNVDRSRKWPLTRANCVCGL